MHGHEILKHIYITVMGCILTLRPAKTLRNAWENNKSNKKVKVKQSLQNRVVNGSVPVRVHSGPGIKEKVEPDPEPEPFRNLFLGSGTGTRTIYGAGLDPGLGLGKELY